MNAKTFFPYCFCFLFVAAVKESNFTTRSIKDIPFNMGFDDPYYFSKALQNSYGHLA